jgi:hypothetical protein
VTVATIAEGKVRFGVLGIVVVEVEEEKEGREGEMEGRKKHTLALPAKSRKHLGQQVRPRWRLTCWATGGTDSVSQVRLD